MERKSMIEKEEIERILDPEIIFKHFNIAKN